MTMTPEEVREHYDEKYAARVRKNDVRCAVSVAHSVAIGMCYAWVSPMEIVLGAILGFTAGVLLWGLNDLRWYIVTAREKEVALWRVDPTASAPIASDELFYLAAWMIYVVPTAIVVVFECWLYQLPDTFTIQRDLLMFIAGFMLWAFCTFLCMTGAEWIHDRGEKLARA